MKKELVLGSFLFIFFSVAAFLALANGNDSISRNKVTDFDLQIVGKAWNKQPGQKGFDIRADFNGDGKINVIDIQILARNWAKHC